MVTRIGCFTAVFPMAGDDAVSAIAGIGIEPLEATEGSGCDFGGVGSGAGAGAGAVAGAVPADGNPAFGDEKRTPARPSSEIAIRVSQAGIRARRL